MKNLLEKKAVKAENGVEFQLMFYILESIVEIEGNAVVVYGIQIDKLDSGGNILLSEQIFDISDSKSEVEKLARKLLEGEVEPENLVEIVTDYVDSCEYMAV